MEPTLQEVVEPTSQEVPTSLEILEPTPPPFSSWARRRLWGVIPSSVSELIIPIAPDVIPPHSTSYVVVLVSFARTPPSFTVASCLADYLSQESTVPQVDANSPSHADVILVEDNSSPASPSTENGSDRSEAP